MLVVTVLLMASGGFGVTSCCFSAQFGVYLNASS